MTIRHATLADLDEMMRIYAHAREMMVANHNPHQWKDYEPQMEIIIERINNNVHYIIENNGHICGAFSLIPGEDPTYSYIEGEWLNSLPYLTIHSIASDNTMKGILKVAIDYGFTIENTIRIDTHKDNSIMLHLLTKMGFTHCGVIYLKNKEPREAFMKTITK